MRRKDREITDSSSIEAFIAKEKILRIAFYDNGDIYIVPVNYGYINDNGKYYFYFPNASKGRGFAVGVAVADRPEGPYIPEPEPIEGINGIDPCVLQASDGNAYIFWGNGRCAKLDPSMTKLADDNPKTTMKWGNREMEMVGVNCLQGLPSRQAEGPFAFEKDGNFYLTYPYVKENTEVLAYAMSKNPMGPYEYKGIIMARSQNECWTNHHSIVNYKGQWYLFYHHNDYSPNFDKNRSVRIDKISFLPDGTIEQVTPTLRGVGETKAIFRIRSAAPAKVSFQTRDEKIVGTFDLPASKDWKEVKFPFETPLTGNQNIKLIVDEGKDLDVDWISFE